MECRPVVRRHRGPFAFVFWALGLTQGNRRSLGPHPTHHSTASKEFRGMPSTSGKISIHLGAAILGLLLFHVAAVNRVAADTPTRFTPLKEVKPRIVANSVAYPGGSYEATNLLDGNERTEYSSASKGKETYIDFDFGRPVLLAGLRHVDRADAATIARSRLTFSNTPDFEDTLAVVDVQHANTRSGRTTFTFPKVTARFVRWQVTELGPKRYATVGGAEIGFFEAGTPETRPSQLNIRSRAADALLRTEDGVQQPLAITVDFPYAETCDATIQVGDAPPLPIRLQIGTGAVAVPPIPAVEQDTVLPVTVAVNGHEVSQPLTVHPVRHWELCFLPHSHNDIGYTHVQTEVEQKQWQYLEDAIQLARATQDYPEGSRFRWNAEVLWAVDSYLKNAPATKREELINAVRRGWVGLDALYGNELTALCGPEELFRLTGFARRVAQQHDLTIDSAMISDVPGYTWGIVPALAHSGVKYFSIGPNHIHRIGHTLEAWGDKPFYWSSPSGQHRVLCWMAGHAYSWFHPGLLGSIKKVQPESLLGYIDELTNSGYPYDMVQIRYSVGGDNGPPDPDLPEFVRDWNTRYVWPRLSIATTGELMREFERRYGDRIPEVRGDFTPYWEDGAATTSARRLSGITAVSTGVRPGGSSSMTEVSRSA
ncbi:MAG: discoidin domain-containing protein [Pirellulaceae bacterium]